MIVETRADEKRRADYEAFVAERRRIWDRSAGFRGWSGYYHKRLQEVFRFLIPSGQRVLELGCGQGDLLAAVAPRYGVGVDFSKQMIESARRRHPELRLFEASVDDIELGERFDIIILSDLINDLWDVQHVLERCQSLCYPHTRIILNSYSRLWQPVLTLARRLELARTTPVPSWITVEDIRNFLDLAGFEVTRHWSEVLWPLGTPLLSTFLNKYVVKLWPFHAAALTNFVIARPQPRRHALPENPTVSVVVPARNEAGNIRDILERTPELGGGTEIIFVEGHSTDNTYEVAEEEAGRFPERRIQLLKQTGSGKADAVRLGFSRAHGDILMILDADLTVPPEDLPRFYDALASGKGEFINGVRLVYPMEQRAMRFFNLVGNKFFSLAFTALLGQAVKDTLCGTKTLWRDDYARIAANRDYFGDFDPFGDFDLLFGAAKLNFKIVDMPIRYHERTYGTTNINRWKHGWMLMKMVLFAARRIKFV